MEQVKVFVKQQFKTEAVDVLKLSAKFPESYSSFQITVFGVAIKDALNLEYWPERALMMKFFRPMIKSLVTSLPLWMLKFQINLLVLKIKDLLLRLQRSQLFFKGNFELMSKLPYYIASINFAH